MYAARYSLRIFDVSLRQTQRSSHVYQSLTCAL